MKINGTIIEYFFHCKRQCWLVANRVNLEDNSEDVRIGRVLHDVNFSKDEVKIENIAIDKLKGDYVVEFKKSDSDVNAAKMQAMLYLKRLKNLGINKKARLEFFEKRKQNSKKIEVELDEKLLESSLKEIEIFLQTPTPPKPVKNASCKKCAYYEICFL